MWRWEIEEEERVAAEQRLSSVLQRDVAAAEEGKARAVRAMEDEFIESALDVMAELVEVSWISADDFWDTMDARKIFTEHPKGSAGLFKKAVKAGILEPIPGVTWPPRRSNSSRELQVYGAPGSGRMNGKLTVRRVLCAECGEFLAVSAFPPGPVFCTKPCLRAHYRGRRAKG